MASDFPVTYMLTLPRCLDVSSVDMKNLKILLTYFLLEALGRTLVVPNVAGTGGPGARRYGASGLVSGTTTCPVPVSP